jgi:hypothetical protein
LWPNIDCCPARSHQVVQTRHWNQHTDGNDRPGHRIAQADRTIRAARDNHPFRLPCCIGEQQREHDCTDRGQRGQNEAVSGKQGKARAELGIAFSQRQSQQQAGW